MQDRNGRGGIHDRYDNRRYNDATRNQERDVYPLNVTRSDKRSYGRDDSQDYINRDGPGRREGGKYGPLRPSAPRYGGRYAPYEHRKQQHWRETKRADEAERYKPQKPLTIADKPEHDAPILSEEAMEHRNGTNDSRGNGKKLANTIGTPSCIAVHNEENVMVRERYNKSYHILSYGGSGPEGGT